MSPGATQYVAEDFSMHAGDTKYLDITVTDAGTGDPFPVDDYTFRWKLASRPAVSKVSAAGISVLSTVDGVVRIVLNPADTEDLAGKFRHQLEAEDVDGAVFTLCQGTATLLRSVVP